MVPPLKKVISYKLWVISFFFFLFLTHNSSLITHNYCYAQESKYIRVATIQDVPSIRLEVNGFYEVIDPQKFKVLYRGKNLKTTVTVYKGGILLRNIRSNSNKLLINSDDPKGVFIDGRSFRGNIQLIKKDDLHVSVINLVELEDYIKGILYHEASHHWPIEALKAQAVVCRTYAIYQMKENLSKDYDVTSDIYSQVYGGRASERYRTNKAVDQTQGIILTYKNKIFPTYYHATCGGHTEDASKLWGIDIAPLKGVACDFCKDSPHFNWHSVLSLDEIQDKLTKAGYKIGNIKDILILGFDKSNRVTDLKIISTKKDVKMSAKDFRNVIGPNIIRSANFKLNLKNHDALFQGLGWGHGVGLCQWGAYFMAKQGYKYDEILKYYYPQTDVGTN